MIYITYEEYSRMVILFGLNLLFLDIVFLYLLFKEKKTIREGEEKGGIK